MRVIVTGGAGFIGSNFIHYLLQAHPEYEVINVDALTYAGNLANLAKVEGHPGYTFVQADVADRDALLPLFAGGVDAVVHLAAESHVDRSIKQPGVFVWTNVVGTQTLLELARQHGVRKYVQVSTDEVYGSLGPEGLFTERTPLDPSSPYSASKAGADLLVQAYHHTYGMDVNITRCSNNYGPYQFPEKLIPLMIQHALEDRPLPVYGDGLNIRDWLHVEDHCRAIDLVLHQGKSGEVYNIGGNNERTNVQVVEGILTALGKPRSLITYVEDRLGHDRRYAIDSAKLQAELGWKPVWDYERGIAHTIQWYRSNQAWLEEVRTGAYRLRSSRGGGCQEEQQ